MATNSTLEYYPLKNTCDVRFVDTDAQGHVNNAVFSSFLEVGRTQIMYHPETGVQEAGAEFVIARLELDYKAELSWPGVVHIGTKIAAVGRSTIQFEQALFQNNRCAALAKAVIVQIGQHNHQSLPISESMRNKLLPYM